jgi:hypothetical protein
VNDHQTLRAQLWDLAPDQLADAAVTIDLPLPELALRVGATTPEAQAALIRAAARRADNVATSAPVDVLDIVKRPIPSVGKVQREKRAAHHRRGVDLCCPYRPLAAPLVMPLARCKLA